VVLSFLSASLTCTLSLLHSYTAGKLTPMESNRSDMVPANRNGVISFRKNYPGWGTLYRFAPPLVYPERFARRATPALSSKSDALNHIESYSCIKPPGGG